MSWKNEDSEALVICKRISKVVNCGTQYVELFFKKRCYFNIIVILLSLGLICGYYYSTKDNEHWKIAFKAVNKQTEQKMKLIGTTFVAKTQKKFTTSIELAYSNSKDAINRKTFHQLPKVQLRNKNSIIEIFTNKSFNNIDDSKKLRLGELKWKFSSKIQ